MIYTQGSGKIIKINITRLDDGGFHVNQAMTSFFPVPVTMFEIG